MIEMLHNADNRRNALRLIIWSKRAFGYGNQLVSVRGQCPLLAISGHLAGP